MFFRHIIPRLMVQRVESWFRLQQGRHIPVAIPQTRLLAISLGWSYQKQIWCPPWRSTDPGCTDTLLSKLYLPVYKIYELTHHRRYLEVVSCRISASRKYRIVRIARTKGFVRCNAVRSLSGVVLSGQFEIPHLFIRESLMCLGQTIVDTRIH
jgi:hypothetical protein